MTKCQTKIALKTLMVTIIFSPHRSLNFELNAQKAKAFQRQSRRGIKWGGSNKREECREGCYKEELEELGMNNGKIVSFAI